MTIRKAHYLVLLAIVATLGGFICSLPQAHAAITFDASSTKNISSATTATTSIIVGGSGSNEMLVIVISNNGANPTGVTVDGTALTKVMAYASTEYMNIWYALGVAAGTHTVSTTFAAGRSGELTAFSFFGVNQSTPLDTTSTAALTTTTSTKATITTNFANDLIIDADAMNGAAAVSSTVNACQNNVVTNSGVTAFQYASYCLATGAGGYTDGWITKTARSGAFGQAAFQAASSGGSAPDATSLTTTVNGDGGRSGDSITVTGTNFGTVSAGNRATCNGGASTGCIEFIVVHGAQSESESGDDFGGAGFA